MKHRIALLIRFVVVSLPATSRPWKNPRMSRGTQLFPIHFRRHDQSREQIIARPPRCSSNCVARYALISSVAARNVSLVAAADAPPGMVRLIARIASFHFSNRCPICRGHTEHFRNDTHRQRHGVIRRQVHLPAREQRLEQLSRNLPDAPLQIRHGLRRKRLCDQRPQLRMPRRIDKYNPIRAHPRAERLVIGQHLLDRRVVEHETKLGMRILKQRRAGAEMRIQRIGITPILIRKQLMHSSKLAGFDQMDNAGNRRLDQNGTTLSAAASYHGGPALKPNSFFCSSLSCATTSGVRLRRKSQCGRTQVRQKYACRQRRGLSVVF